MKDEDVLCLKGISFDGSSNDDILDRRRKQERWLGSGVEWSEK